MGTYSYTLLAPEIPPIPIITVQLATPGLIPSTKVECQAILDTGSDCTLVPLPFLRQVNGQVADRLIRIPVGGRIAIGIPHEVGLIFDQHTYPVVRVFGCPVDDIGEVILIGRDVLNRHRIEFDGQSLTFTIF